MFSETLVILSFTYPKIQTLQTIRSFLLFPGYTGHNIASSPSPIFILSSLLVILGGIIRVTCFQTLGSSFTFELSFRQGQRLIKSGLYSTVRHPSYTGAVLSLGPMIVIHLSRGSWVRESGILESTVWGRVVALVWFGGMAMMIYTVVVRIKSEEEFLKKEFGVEWERYKEEVRYRLCPGVY
ncbi:hypothetical protein D9758_005217 [Tetrapyrgos nigripes]|uniref:Protein-S-isoprenylcysteine O-methyltransferase n=1 Tax=Tetrapyrgos nigripes TaxID=182062 RepID=A0A8H5GXE0_9AGAR|nr:hypothetical protein D9758_005217 [Tetrapyrgos nigripes]